MLFLFNLRGIAAQRSDRATLESFISKTESLSYSDQRLASNASNDCYRNALVQVYLCVCFTSAFHGSMLSPSTSQAWFNPIKVCRHLASALQLSLYTNDVLYSHYLSLLSGVCFELSLCILYTSRSTSSCNTDAIVGGCTLQNNEMKR